MKRVILVRHGKAESPSMEIHDHDRQLKERGVKDAFKMGIVLSEKEIIPDIVLVSSAVRAQQTADQIAKSINVPMVTRKELYNAPQAQIEELLWGQDDALNSIALIGHNPAFEHLAAATGGQFDEMPTCGIAVIDFESLTGWNELLFREGTLVEMLSPKNL